jgi:hypothetical protein
MRLAAWGLAIAMVLATAPGCGSKASWAAAEKRGKIDRDSGVALDEGRVMVYSPSGWTRAPRSKDYLVRYTPSSQKTSPAITLTAADPPAGIKEVTEGSQAEFVEAIAGQLAEKHAKDGKSTLLEDAEGVTLGDHRAVAWAAPGMIVAGKKKEKVEFRSVAVVVGGRMYTVEVRTPKDKPDEKAFAAARGVAAALTVPAKNAPADEPSSEEPAGAEKPAAENPAEAKPAEEAKPAAEEAKPSAE